MASRALSLITKVNSVLNKFSPADRTVYKRVITNTGGDSLIGRNQTPSFTDTIFTPQPTYQRLARYDVGPGSRSEMVLQAGARDVANNYMFLFSSSAISPSDLDSGTTQIVLQDGQGNKEVFQINDYDEPAAMGGVDIIYIVYATSVARP